MLYSKILFLISFVDIFSVPASKRLINGKLNERLENRSSLRTCENLLTFWQLLLMGINHTGYVFVNLGSPDICFLTWLRCKQECRLPPNLTIHVNVIRYLNYYQNQ